VTDRQTGRRTDGIAMAYTHYSIYAVTRNNMQSFTVTTTFRIHKYCKIVVDVFKPAYKIQQLYFQLFQGYEWGPKIKMIT